MTDFRFALRRLRRQPGFALTAVLTLGLCLGANLTIFAVFDSALIRGLPYQSPQQLITVYNSYPKAGLERDRTSLHNYYAWRERVDAFESVSALRYGTELIGATGATERRKVIRISPEFFATLGTQPVLGRAFNEAETTPGQGQSVIISDAYWRQHYAADRQILGQKMRVSGNLMTIVGVLAPDFRWIAGNAQIYVPLVSNAEQRAVNSLHVGSVDAIARLKPGVTIAQAQRQVEADNQIQSRNFPWADEVNAAGFRVTVVNLQADHVAAIRPSLLLLQIGVLCLLLIGSVNLVNLMLVRVSARRKEIAVRQALGAGRLHLLREVLSESLLLSALGGLLALGVCAAGIAVMTSWGADRLPMVAPLAVNGRLLLTAVAAALSIALVMALPALWSNLRRPSTDAIHAEARGGSANRSSQRLRHGFIVGQIALAFVLLSCAGLLALSLQRSMAVDPGFRADNLLTAELALTSAAHQRTDDRVQFVDRLLNRMANLPGVSAAAISTNLPARGVGSDNETNVMTIVGQTPEPGTPPSLHYTYGVSGDYLKAMAIPLVAGRFLDQRDDPGSSRNCVVDQDFADIHWPDGNAVGQRLFNGPDPGPANEAFNVVGVVGSVKQTDFTEGRGNGTIYFPYRYFSNSDVYLVARSQQPAQSLAPVLRGLLGEIDPELALAGLSSMQNRIDTTFVARKSPALLALAFASIALVLAGIGTYGVFSYAVALRRHEVGLRMAVGAMPGQIRQHFMGLGLRVFVTGSLIGLAGSWLAGRLMGGMLFAVSSFDPTVLLTSATLLAAVSLLACLIPSQRAAAISPMTVLNDQ